MCKQIGRGHVNILPITNVYSLFVTNTKKIGQNKSEHIQRRRRQLFLVPQKGIRHTSGHPSAASLRSITYTLTPYISSPEIHRFTVLKIVRHRQKENMNQNILLECF